MVEAMGDCSMPRSLAILFLSKNNVPVVYSCFLLYYTSLYFLVELRHRKLCYYLAWILVLSLVFISAISLCEYFSVLTHNAVTDLEGDSYRQVCEKNRNKLLANEVFFLKELL